MGARMEVSWRGSPAELERLRIVRSCIELDLVRSKNKRPITAESIATETELIRELATTNADITAMKAVTAEARRAMRWENGGAK